MHNNACLCHAKYHLSLSPFVWINRYICEHVQENDSLTNNKINIMEDVLREVLLPISITVVLPIVMVWLNIKSKKHESDNRTGVLLAAIEKNSDVDIEELMRKMNMQDKSHTTLKERLLKKLLWGSIVTAVGTGLLGYALYMDFQGGVATYAMRIWYMSGGVTLLIGLAILLVFFISKRMLAKELEMESEKQRD